MLPLCSLIGLRYIHISMESKRRSSRASSNLVASECSRALRKSNPIWSGSRPRYTSWANMRSMNLPSSSTRSHKIRNFRSRKLNQSPWTTFRSSNSWQHTHRSRRPKTCPHHTMHSRLVEIVLLVSWRPTRGRKPHIRSHRHYYLRGSTNLQRITSSCP